MLLPKESTIDLSESIDRQLYSVRTYARRNNARRIWAGTPQNCATTNLITFEKHTYFRSLSVRSDAIYRISA